MTTQRPSVGKRILLVTPQPFYDDRGTPIAVEHTVRALSNLGHAVDVLAFPFGSNVRISRVKTVRCGNPWGIGSVPIGFSWQKCLLDASLSRKFGRMLRRGNYDAVHAVEEAAYIASQLCGRAGVPYVYDMASSIPAELAQKPLLGSVLGQQVLGSIERNVIQRSTHVLCSMGLAKHVKSRSPDAAVTEWQFPAEFSPTPEATTASMKRELNIGSDDHVIVYAGNFAKYQGMPLLFSAFAKTLEKDPNALLLCVGASEKEREAALASLPPKVADRMRIVTRRPRTAIPSYLALADCLVSIRPINRNLPLKVFEYMASGKPIVATRGLGHEPLLNAQRAYLCDPQAESIAASIVEALKPGNRSTEVSRSAKEFAKRHYGWDNFVHFLGGVYDGVLESRPVGEFARA